MKYVDAAVCYGAGVAFDTIQYFNRFNPNPAVHPEVDGQAAAEVLAEDQADAWLAAADRFALPRVRQGSAGSDHRRQEGLDETAAREGRRNQGRRSSNATARSGWSRIARSTAISKT